MSDLDSLFLDKRPISEMAFGAEEKTPARQTDTADRVRGVLAACGVAIADDINRLGCTGVLAKAKAAKEEKNDVFADEDRHAAIDVAKFLRLGLAGGGVGLPCFVPSTLYCLVHNTIGGLQDNQKALYPECVGMISRPLTDAERGQFELVNAVRKKSRNNPDEAADILSGREQVPGVVETGEGDDLDDDDVQVLQGARLGAQTWKCPEHTTTNWACRYCVAQAIVEGPLVPLVIVSGSRAEGELSRTGQVMSASASPSVEAALESCNARGDTVVELFVRVATFTRKLSRD